MTTQIEPYKVLSIIATVRLHGTGLFGLADSVWPFQSGQFQSQDI